MISSTSIDKITVVSKFKPLYETFDSSLARKLAELIQQSYRQFDYVNPPLDRPQNLGSWQLNNTFKLIAPLGTSAVPFGFVASGINSEDVFVVFRGTKKFIEWFKDVNIQLVSYKDSKGKNEERVEIKAPIADDVIVQNQSATIINTNDDFGFVTAGFRGIYISLRKQLLEALNGLPNNSRVFVTGHSLGGALATLAVPDILNNTHFKKHQNIVLYTFASPRCGDRKFAESFKNTKVQHWRIANTEDVVTMMPFPTGNVFEPAPPETPPEFDKSLSKSLTSENEYVVDSLGIGGVTGVDRNPNPLFGFFKAMYDRNKRRMPDYVHTGTPIYFTIHQAALERHHNLDEVYMVGIGQDRL